MAASRIRDGLHHRSKGAAIRRRGARTLSDPLAGGARVQALQPEIRSSAFGYLPNYH